MGLESLASRGHERELAAVDDLRLILVWESVLELLFANTALAGWEIRPPAIVNHPLEI